MSASNRRFALYGLRHFPGRSFDGRFRHIINAVYHEDGEERRQSFVATGDTPEAAARWAQRQVEDWAEQKAQEARNGV